MTCLMPRGVHREHVLSCDGHPILISVDHDNKEVQRRVILPGENPMTVAAILWEHLDSVDPEYSRRRRDKEQGRQVASVFAALLCMSFALEKLAFL